MSARGNQSPESVVKEIRRNTRRKYTSEEKIRVVLVSVFFGESSVRTEGGFDDGPALPPASP